MTNIRESDRVKRTKSALRSALLSLMMRKPVDHISIKELCETAGIYRGTFYAHYDRPEQILKEVEDELYAVLRSYIDSYEHSRDIPKILAKALTLLAEKKDLAMVMLGSYGDTEFMERLINLAHDICIASWGGQSPEVSVEQLEASYQFIASGTLRLIREWLISGAEKPPVELAALIYDLCNFGVGSIVSLPKTMSPTSVLGYDNFEKMVMES